MARKQAAPKAAVTLESYDDAYLQCRESHWWSIVGMFYDGEGHIIREWKCMRCPTTRRQIMTSSGEYVKSPRYKYPVDYKLGASVSRVEVRAEIIRRTKVYRSEKSMLSAAVRSNGKNRSTYAVHKARQKASK